MILINTEMQYTGRMLTQNQQKIMIYLMTEKEYLKKLKFLKQELEKDGTDKFNYILDDINRSIELSESIKTDDPIQDLLNAMNYLEDSFSKLFAVISKKDIDYH